MAEPIQAWLAGATADAEARGLPALKPLLETLARSLQALRDADAEFGHPAFSHFVDQSGDQLGDQLGDQRGPDDEHAR